MYVNLSLVVVNIVVAFFIPSSRLCISLSLSLHLFSSPSLSSFDYHSPNIIFMCWFDGMKGFVLHVLRMEDVTALVYPLLYFIHEGRKDSGTYSALLSLSLFCCEVTFSKLISVC
jgi:hypothetical protein